MYCLISGGKCQWIPKLRYVDCSSIKCSGTLLLMYHYRGRTICPALQKYKKNGEFASSVSKKISLFLLLFFVLQDVTGLTVQLVANGFERRKADSFALSGLQNREVCERHTYSLG